MNKNIVLNSNSHQKIEIDDEILEIVPLGSGSEVGRSCVYLQFMGIKIMLDCGIHPAYNGVSSLPYFDLIDPSEIDLLLITHFHLDHSGALPYFLSKTNFKGDCYMTNPTKSVYQHLLSDYIKVSHVRTEESLYDEYDLEKSLKMIKTIDFKEPIIFHKTVNNYDDKDSNNLKCLDLVESNILHLSNNNNNSRQVKFTAYAAGHVLGAAMFLIEINGIKILYTGDFSREIDRHLQPAEIPHTEVNVLIIESTYGIHKHDPRSEREAFFVKYVADIVRNGGKCLLPVMVSGRAQELLLILEDFWDKNEDLKKVKIFYISSLAKKCMDIFKSYINIMGDAIKKKHLYEGSRNPFDFNYIISVKNLEEVYKYNYKDDEPVVIFASPGMLQNGLSRDLFDKWCENPLNGVIISGYCVEGTLARYLMSEPKEIELSNGKKVKLNMKVKSVTFSAHSDFNDTSSFIQKIKPKKIILVHGEGKEMKRLKEEMERNMNNKNQKELDVNNYINKNNALSSTTNIVNNSNVEYEGVVFKSYVAKIYNPQNCQRIQLQYKISKNKKIYIVGSLFNKINYFYPNYVNKVLIKNNLCALSNKESDNVEKNNDTNNLNTTVINNNIDINSANKMIIDDDFIDEDNELDDDNFVEFNGIIIEDKVIDPEELDKYSSKKAFKLKNIISIEYNHDKLNLVLILKSMYNMEYYKPNIVKNNILIIKIYDSSVTLEWLSSAFNDKLADSISFLIYQLDKYPDSNLAKEYASKQSLIDTKKDKLIKYLSLKYKVVLDEEDLTGDNILLLYDKTFSKKLICTINLSNNDIKVNESINKDKIEQELNFFQII